MTCTEVEARLIDLAEDRLDPAAGVRVHEHMERCPECRGRAELWQDLVPSLRALAPEPPDAMRTRRMQIEIARALSGVAPPDARGRRWTWMPWTFGLAAVAAALFIWLRPAPSDPTARLAVGSTIELGADSETTRKVGRGSKLRLAGPGRLTLRGSERDVVVDLAFGTVEVGVTHRDPDESFVVVTRDLRVEVRGTRFTVGAGQAGSWVRVDEGRVAVAFANGDRRLVSAGERVSSPAPALAPEPAINEPPATAPVAEEPETPEPGPSCGAAVRACQAAARGARQNMRAGSNDRALRAVTEAVELARDRSAACGSNMRSCADELRYLRAEALRGAGRLAAAIDAYQAIDREGAPPAMRQNALYAAAQLEQRRGRARQASASFERALAVAPRGALREEALAGAMDSAAAAGDERRARAFAHQYLAEFPIGLRAEAARRRIAAGKTP